MLSGERETSPLAAHSSPFRDLLASVAIPSASQIYVSVSGMSFLNRYKLPPSIITYISIQSSINAKGKENGNSKNRDIHEPPVKSQSAGAQGYKGQTGHTWMFSFPNSLFRLCESERSANLAAENTAVVVLPRKDAVAPVKRSVPRLPPRSSSIVCAWNALTTSRANAKAALMFVSATLSTSSSVICRKGFHTAKPALKSATRTSAFGQCARTARNALCTSW